MLYFNRVWCLNPGTLRNDYFTNLVARVLDVAAILVLVPAEPVNVTGAQRSPLRLKPALLLPFYVLLFDLLGTPR